MEVGRITCDCGAAMVARYGKHGAFLGCTTYPECHGKKQTPQSGPPCPKCSKPLILRKGRNGHSDFYGCREYFSTRCMGSMSIDLAITAWQEGK